MTWTMADIRATGRPVVGDTGAREIAPNGRKPEPESIHESKEIAPYAEREGAMRANAERVYLPVSPVGKPRMTQRDKWQRRPAVVRYRDYADAIRLHWPDNTPFPPAGAHVVFHLPMPKSWSKKRKAEMDGQPHQQKPDKDNLEKALLDALHDDDAHIWDARVTKRWARVGYIEIFINNNLESTQ